MVWCKEFKGILNCMGENTSTVGFELTCWKEYVLFENCNHALIRRGRTLGQDILLSTQEIEAEGWLGMF